MKTNTCFITIMAVICFISNAMAQNTQGIEIGLRMQPSAFSQNNGELVFKNQVTENKWRRLSVGDFEASFFPKNNLQKVDVDVSFGRERRWFIVNNTRNNTQFALITGRELTIGSRYVGDSRAAFPKRNMQNSTIYLGANAVFGMQYAFCRRFAINAEITPGIDVETLPYLNANDVPTRKTQLNYHIWNPRVSIVYRLRS